MFISTFFLGKSLLFLFCKKNHRTRKKTSKSGEILKFLIAIKVSYNCLDECAITKSLKIENYMVTHFDNQHFQNNQLTLNKTINEMFEFINELYTKNTNILEII